jgi:hypothetical protein
VEGALRLTGEKQLAAIARWCYLRGKILHSLCSSAHTISFPTSLLPDSPEHKAKSGNSSVKTPVYQSSAEILQECIASFTRAYHLYRSLDDELQIGKTVCHIAHVWSFHLLLLRLCCCLSFILCALCRPTWIAYLRLCCC